MAPAQSNPPILGIAKALVDHHLLSEIEARNAISGADMESVPLLKYMVEKGLVNSTAVANILSGVFALPFFDLNALDLTDIPVDIVGIEVIEKHRVLPLFNRGGKKLFIAVSDPINVAVLSEIKFKTRLNTEPILVEENKLSRAIEKVIEANDTSMDNLDEELADIELVGDDAHDDGIISADVDDAPIVKFVNSVLLTAIKREVSDLHFEPYEKIFRIRFRGDGILYEYARPPLNITTRLISRIKVMAKMDIAEKRIPQDGRIKLRVSKSKNIDFRVNTCPTLFGEKVVMRILDSSNAQMGIEKLGFEPDQQKIFTHAINRPYGMVLVTGPTGSGKTVSLYTGLNMINRVGTNISTAEDPVEITVDGINQVNVNPKAGLSFAVALKAFLRQDPDIIMVGEIRDLETASISVKAAQTGHLVLSTLHTNDAPQTINRLMQMGIEPFNIVSAVNLVMAQRLARRLCASCKEPAEFSDKILLKYGFKAEELQQFTVYKPVGCDRCNRGYKGRVGIYQVMPVTEKIKKLILAGGNAMELATLAKAEGINDLRASGLLKIKQGITTLEEIDRITGE
ncbi:MAG: type IV-A pilus assembly ATPase PilB [Methylococcales bacterium]|nr:type IV-A pilus assembly ATPase PilB [Methylococcales bacterium]